MINNKHLEELLKPIFIDGLLETINWYKSDAPYYLRSIFNQVGFKDRDGKEAIYYTSPSSLSSQIVYPKSDKNGLKRIKKEVLEQINEYYKAFSKDYLDSLNSNQLLFLLEKFGGNVPIKESEVTSIFDVYKIKAAKAVIQLNRENLEHHDNLLINIDLSGIQRFIYNISSSGASKNLRSRSFFVELLSNHLIYKVLNALNLHYVNVIMNGGGNIYILSGCPKEDEDPLINIAYSLNRWFLREFNGKLYAAFSYVKCSDEELKMNLPGLLREISNQAFTKKRMKFKAIIERGEFPFVEETDPNSQSCEICYRDDSTIRVQEEEVRCSLCQRLIELGNQIPKAKFIYSYNKDDRECLPIEASYYLLSEVKKDLRCLWVVFEDREDFIEDIEDSATYIFVKTYITKIGDLDETVLRNKETESMVKEDIAPLEDIAESSKGAKLIGALRMDADNIGKILHSGFYEGANLELLSSLSRNMNYFFKLYLESLCKGTESLSTRNNHRLSGHVIYAGGDDLFILGAWDKTASLAIDIGKAFKKYTCENIDIGLSGGLTLHNPKFPVSKMAETSMRALKTAKENLEPCWMCRKEWITCPLYEIGKCLRKDSFAPFFTEYLLSRKKKFSERFRTPKYSQEPPRLKLALKWEKYKREEAKVVDEVNEYILKPLDAFKKGSNLLPQGFFHNTLNLLEIWYNEDLLYLPKIVWGLEKVKRELKKQKIESEEGKSLYELYEMYLHFNKGMFSTLYIPLSWVILLTRGGDEIDYEKANGGKTL
ncbi:MAG: type III-A CRISPR-associated protein Cas10/Csm1 [bacterium]